MHQQAEFGLAAHWSYKESHRTASSLGWISGHKDADISVPTTDKVCLQPLEIHVFVKITSILLRYELYFFHCEKKKVSGIYMLNYQLIRPNSTMRVMDYCDERPSDRKYIPNTACCWQTRRPLAPPRNMN